MDLVQNILGLVGFRAGVRWFAAKRPRTAREGQALGADGSGLVGRRVSVWWEGEDDWYDGSIVEYNVHNGQHRVQVPRQDPPGCVLLPVRLPTRRRLPPAV